MRLRPILEGAVVVVFALLIWNNFALRRQQAVMARAAVQSRGFVPKDEIGDVSMVDLSGVPARLRLGQGRHVVAVVDPRCESCRELVATLRPTPDLVVVSVAPPELTRTMAAQAGLAAVTHTLGQRSASPWRIYPQVLVVDGGRVVRTCLTVAECR
jgi:hypothetical protein